MALLAIYGASTLCCRSLVIKYYGTLLHIKRNWLQQYGQLPPLSLYEYIFLGACYAITHSGRMTTEEKDKKYTTKGLPPPPDVSLTTMPMAGLLVDVYGLEELPASPAPVTCLWLLHPRTRTRASMNDVAKRAIHSWSQKGQARGLVALAFDMPNHGTRMVSAKANLAWDEGEGNENHGIDMFGLVKGGMRTMSGLMDQVGSYLGREADAHVCLGWSLGGHAVWQAWFGEERIDAGVAIVGCPDLTSEFSMEDEIRNEDGAS